MAAQLPKSTWGYAFTRENPELRLEILNRIEVGPGRLLVEVRMTGARAGLWGRVWSRYPGVQSVERLEETSRSVLYRVVSETPPIHAVVRDHQILTRYPIVAQDGWSVFETFAEPTQMALFLKSLGERVGPNRVESVRQGVVSLQSLGLTPAQDVVFRAALSEGYFRFPRGISVSALAGKLGRSKSSVSVALAKIQRKLADSALHLDLSRPSTPG